MSQTFTTIGDVAEQFGISPRTVRRYISAGRLTAYRVGPRLIRLDAEEARRVLMAGRMNKTP